MVTENRTAIAQIMLPQPTEIQFSKEGIGSLAQTLLSQLTSVQFLKEEIDSFLKAVRTDDFQPKEIVERAKALNPLLAEQFEKDTGNWEQFSLERHSVAVLSQYKKYIRDDPLLARVDKTFFLVFLTFHDIGKPLSVEMGNKDLQHQVSAPVLRHILNALQFSNYTALSDSLLSGDILGKYIKGKHTLEQTVLQLKTCAKNAKYPPKEFYSLLKGYYLADASAYTKNAIPSFYPNNEAGLGWLFTFDESGVHFRPEGIKRKMALLDAALPFPPPS